MILDEKIIPKANTSLVFDKESNINFIDYTLEMYYLFLFVSNLDKYINLNVFLMKVKM